MGRDTIITVELAMKWLWMADEIQLLWWFMMYKMMYDVFFFWDTNLEESTFFWRELRYDQRHWWYSDQTTWRHWDSSHTCQWINYESVISSTPWNSATYRNISWVREGFLGQQFLSLRCPRCPWCPRGMSPYRLPFNKFTFVGTHNSGSFNLNIPEIIEEPMAFPGMIWESMREV